MSDNDEVIEAESSPSDLAVRAESVLSVSSGGALLPPVETQAIVLAEHDRRKRAFMGWLKEKFQPGVHYGTPAGCEPRAADSDKWRHKDSLYDGGARLFIDLFGLRPTYESDLGAWEMLGKKPGSFCRKCVLMRPDGTKAGEGTGIFLVGEKKMNENSAIKMAEKRARVSAVLDAIPFARELFTQDLEDMATPIDQLTAFVAEGLAEHGGTMQTAEFLAKVAAVSLFGKTVITNNAEARRIMSALDNGEFDWRTGERIRPPHRGERGEQGDAGEAGHKPPQNSDDSEPAPADWVEKFLTQTVPAARKGESDVADADWIAGIAAAEYGKEVGAMSRAELKSLAAAVKAGQFDPATGEMLP